MKISFKQQGGAMPPYLSYQPFTPTAGMVGGSGQQQTTQTSSSSKKDDDNNLKDKDLMTMLKDIDGLPNDMAIVVSNIQSMYELQKYAPYTGQNMVSMYLSALLKSKQATFNKSLYTDAYNLVKENKGLSEIAITTNGTVIVQDSKTGEMKNVTLKDYQKNVKRYIPVTNAALLNNRAHSSSQAFNNNVFPIVSNGIGMEKVSDLLKANLMSLATDKTEQAFSAYKMNGTVMEGLDMLKKVAQGTPIDGLYEGKVISESNSRQIKAALNYLMGILPDNAKVLLKVKAAQMGLGANGDQELVLQMLQAQNKTDYQVQFQYKGSYDVSGKDKNVSGSSNDVELGTAAQFLMGLGPKEQFMIVDETNEGLPVYSNMMPITKNNTNTGQITLGELTSSDMAGLLDLTNISMGGLMISPTGLNNAMIDGQAHNIDMVYDKEAASKGIIKPDFKALKRKSQADKEIKAKNIAANNYSAINEIYKKYQLPWIYDSQGNLNTTDYAKFAVFNGFASTKAFAESQQAGIDFDDYLKELGDTETENAVRAFTHKDDKFKFNKGSWLSSGDSMYRGTVFIPIREDSINTVMGKLNPTQAMVLDNSYADRQAQMQRAEKVHRVNPNDVK